MRRFFALGMLLGVALGGCAALSCRPASIEVASKEERARLATVPRGLRPAEIGVSADAQIETPMREYWVKSQAGTWYRVSSEEFRAARSGETVEICQ